MRTNSIRLSCPPRLCTAVKDIEQSHQLKLLPLTACEGINDARQLNPRPHHPAPKHRGRCLSNLTLPRPYLCETLFTTSQPGQPVSTLRTHLNMLGAPPSACRASLVMILVEFCLSSPQRFGAFPSDPTEDSLVTVTFQQPCVRASLRGSENVAAAVTARSSHHVSRPRFLQPTAKVGAGKPGDSPRVTDPFVPCLKVRAMALDVSTAIKDLSRPRSIGSTLQQACGKPASLLQTSRSGSDTPPAPASDSGRCCAKGF